MPGLAREGSQAMGFSHRRGGRVPRIGHPDVTDGYASSAYGSDRPAAVTGHPKRRTDIRARPPHHHRDARLQADLRRAQLAGPALDFDRLPAQVVTPDEAIGRAIPELVVSPGTFDHPNWLFELKHDEFRALAHVDGHQYAPVPPRPRLQTIPDVGD